MYKKFGQRLAVTALLAAGLPAAAAGQNAPAAAQNPPAATQDPAAAPPPAAAAPDQEPAALGRYQSRCGNDLPAPAAEPPAGSMPVMLFLEVCFGKDPGASSVVPSETYQYYIQVTRFISAPSAGKWIPYTAAIEQTMRDDFKRLWDQGFLDDLSIEVTDYAFPNGVIGKLATYHLEERERIKTVRYEGTKQIDRTKIEEQLRDRNMIIAADTFLDESKIRRVETMLREMMQEKGFDATVTHTVEPITGGEKTVNVLFEINEGPRRKIKSVAFDGNKAFSDKKLARQLKDNKPTGLLGIITGAGSVNQNKFEDDAAHVEDYYQNRGYPNVRVGTPEVRIIEHSDNAKTQWVELRIPVTEGKLYHFGDVDFDGNKQIRSDFLRSLYQVKPGDIFSRKKLDEGNKKAQEVYGSLGFMEFTPFKDLNRSDEAVSPAFAALDATVPAALAPITPLPPATTASAATTPTNEPPKVDVTIRITEGEQFFINRITFTGNNTTRDNVVRREMGRLLEGAPFDTEALKSSVRRINQLGYFKPLEGTDKDLKVEKTPNRPNMVDLTVKLEEQNRNQLTFGAGISQYEGFFGQLAFQTSNFLGRGETFSVSAQGGERAKNYQVGFTEPYIFDRNMTAGIDLHKRELQYTGYYTQKSTGGSLLFGVPVGPFTRVFTSYSYEQVGISDLSEALVDTSCIVSAEGCAVFKSISDLSQLTTTQQAIIQRNPFIADSLLLGSGGNRTISKISPSIVHNTVDHPIFPTTGRKYTAAVDLAVLGGNTQYIKPHVEGIWYFRQTSRTSLGFRGQFEYISPVNEDNEECKLPGRSCLPIFENLFLGGEYSIRGFDIRSIGPTIPGSQVVLGGNKSLLFNAEYLISIAGPVRLVLFYDAGQVRKLGDKFAWQEDLTRVVLPAPPLFQGSIGNIVTDAAGLNTTTAVVGQTSAFKTSTGVELRFFMPVLNVPFRLIYAWNPQRGGVLDNNLQPAKAQTFRFAVGTTF
jgi:outer membrane protein insertion porin family